MFEKRKKILITMTGFFAITGLFMMVILFLYFKGDRDNFINSNINNFSANYPRLAHQLRKTTKILDIFYLQQQFIDSPIPEFNLFIAPGDWQRLNENLPPPFAGKKLLEEHKKFVKAKIIYKDGQQTEDFEVEVRYRGDNENHWAFAKKSWRIKFINKNFLDRIEAINLILPEDRYFYIESLAAHIGQKLSLMTATIEDKQVVNLKVNEQLQGVYLMTEQFGEVFLANRKKNAKANFYGEREFVEPRTEPIYTKVDYFKKYTALENNPPDDFSDLEIFLNIVNNYSDNEFNQTIGQVLDLENFFRWQVQSTVLFSRSQNSGHNIVLYSNPDTGKFEIVPWNVAMVDANINSVEINNYDYNPIVRRILQNPQWLERRNQLLYEYISNQENLRDDLEFYDRLYRLTRGSFYRGSLKLFSNLEYDLAVQKWRKRLVATRDKLKIWLKETKQSD